MADLLREDIDLRIKLGKSFDKTQGQGGKINVVQLHVLE